MNKNNPQDIKVKKLPADSLVIPESWIKNALNKGATNNPNSLPSQQIEEILNKYRRGIEWLNNNEPKAKGEVITHIQAMQELTAISESARKEGFEAGLKAQPEYKVTNHHGELPHCPRCGMTMPYGHTHICVAELAKSKGEDK